jgi:mono/diheme cytochrome c family protein
MLFGLHACASMGEEAVATGQKSPAPLPSSQRAVREFLGLGAAPDPDAVKRGAPLYAANCSFCHGPTARGAEGPSLVYSEIVLKDTQGAALIPFLQTGRPDRGMPSFSSLSEAQRHDIAEFLHQQVEEVANRGTYQLKNIVLGDAKQGSVYVSQHCSECHSVSGDLKGLGAKWLPQDLQRNWIMPPRAANTAIRATVHTSAGQVSGRVVRLDDFTVLLDTGSGVLTSVERHESTRVTLDDPLARHVALIGTLSDRDMINVTAYLESLK